MQAVIMIISTINSIRIRIRIMTLLIVLSLSSLPSPFYQSNDNEQ